jgi:predicted signal transduction protein with EAL and GGDEF domain
VGRFGGDEFLVLCEELHDESEAMIVADRVRCSLHGPFVLGDEHVHTTASVGVALPRESSTSADLIREADVAMYRAKELGKDRTERFVDELHVRAVERLQLERDLRVALETGQLVVHYQPLVRVADGMPVALEALVRWDRPGAGLVAPDRFIGVAEETGLISELGELVLADAVATLARVDEIADELADQLAGEVFAPLTMSVNVSTRQLATSRLADQLAAMVDEGVDASRLCLEVTENALLIEVDRARAVLDRVHAFGVQVAIDDFGTGYASLDYLRRFTSATALKIDRSFVAGIEGDAHDRAIVAASVVLAQRLGLTAVAEGVEVEAQHEFLRRVGCDAAQGYLFSRPVPADEVGNVVVELARRAAQK